MDISVLNDVLQSFSHIPDTDSRSKISPRGFICALVTAASLSEKFRAIAALRRHFVSELGVSVCRSSFWQRLTSKRLTTYLSKLVTSLAIIQSGRLLVGSKLFEKLGAKGVYLLDSSSISLPDKAAVDFPGPRNTVIPASAKWHLCLGLFGQVTDWFCITESKTHDRMVFPPFEMLRGCLIIFDLGYWDYQLLLDLKKTGCYFLSRVKDGSKIIITGLPSRQDWQAPLGQLMTSINWKKFRGDIFELIGELKTSSGDEFEVRVIGFWNKSTKNYHWYVTNLGVEAKLIYLLYRVRWQVELQFKAAKTSLQLADMPSANPSIIVNLLLASIAATLLSTICGRAALDQASDEIQNSFSLQRAAKVFTHYAQQLRCWLETSTEQALLALSIKIRDFVTEFVDPNYKHRPNSLQLLQLIA